MFKLIMNKVYKFKLNLKESEIPKFIKLPNYVLPQYPLKEKPNVLLTPKIDFKKVGVELINFYY